MNRTKPVLVAAFVSLAMAFTFSCSDSSGNGGNAESIMKSKISGVSQKGPFVESSTVTLYELNSKFEQTGRSFRDIIADNKGSFEIKNIELVSPYAMLEADGFYRNEITGDVSTAPIKLFAIVDIREKDQVNVNILTHLEYYRVLNLVENEGKSVKEAKKQAQKEILTVFGIDSDSFKDSEDMSIFGTSESDAALLAVSILLQRDLSEGEFSQRLTNFSQAIKSGGVWNDDAAKMDIADMASTTDLPKVRDNILGWGLASAVPDFEKYVRNYWASNYGLGECNSASNGVMKQNTNSNSDNSIQHFICNGSYWEFTWPELFCSIPLPGKNYASNSYQSYYVGYAGIAIEPVLSCSAGKLSNPSWTSALNLSAPNWGNPSPGKYYYVSATATCGSASLSVNCGSLFVAAQPMFGNDVTYGGQTYKTVVIGTQTWMAENLNYDVPNNDYDLCYGNDPAYCVKYGRLYDWVTAMALPLSCYSSNCSEQIETKHRGICPSGWHIPNDSDWDMLMTTVGGGSGGEGEHLKDRLGWRGCTPFDDHPISYFNTYLCNDTYGFSALPGGHGGYLPDGHGGYDVYEYRVSVSGYEYGFRYADNYGYWWSASDCNNGSASYRNMDYNYAGVFNNCRSKELLYSVRCVKDN